MSLEGRACVSPYKDGAEFWRDNALNYGIDEATTICGSYLGMNLVRRQPEPEKQFCRELFAAMYEATADRLNAVKLVYPYTYEEAYKRTEASFYDRSRELNNECAHAIDSNIRASCYELNYYNLETAAMKVVMDYGFSRVNMVLAFNIQRHQSDGRLSSANRRWAGEFILPEKALNGAYIRSHMTLVEDFCNHVRELYTNLNAERFVLPGKAESGEYNSGFEITRAVMVDKNQGYAVAHNPSTVNPYVCWQFYIRDGERSYNWGHYTDTEQEVVDNFIARIFVALVHI